MRARRCKDRRIVLAWRFMQCWDCDVARSDYGIGPWMRQAPIRDVVALVVCDGSVGAGSEKNRDCGHRSPFRRHVQRRPAVGKASVQQIGSGREQLGDRAAVAKSCGNEDPCEVIGGLCSRGDLFVRLAIAIQKGKDQRRVAIVILCREVRLVNQAPVSRTATFGLTESRCPVGCPARCRERWCLRGHREGPERRLRPPDRRHARGCRHFRCERSHRYPWQSAT